MKSFGIFFLYFSEDICVDKDVLDFVGQKSFICWMWIVIVLVVFGNKYCDV